MKRHGDGDIFLFWFFCFFLHGERCTGAFRSARTKGTWDPLSNRCVHSGSKKTEKEKERRFVIITTEPQANSFSDPPDNISRLQHAHSVWHFEFVWPLTDLRWRFSTEKCERSLCHFGLSWRSLWRDQATFVIKNIELKAHRRG